MKDEEKTKKQLIEELVELRQQGDAQKVPDNGPESFDEALQDSEQKYRVIFELSPEAIVLLDTKGHIIDMNGRVYDWLGYKPEEIIGKNILQLPVLAKKSKLKVMRKFTLRMLGKKLAPYDIIFINKSGEKHVGRIRANQIKDKDGNITADLVMISEVTELRRFEDERKKLIRELKEALAKIQTLRGLVPICSSCKKIRDDKGYWHQVETYVSRHSEAQFSHGMCPDCMKELYPKYQKTSD